MCGTRCCITHSVLTLAMNVLIYIFTSFSSCMEKQCAVSVIHIPHQQSRLPLKCVKLIEDYSIVTQNTGILNAFIFVKCMICFFRYLLLIILKLSIVYVQCTLCSASQFTILLSIQYQCDLAVYMAACILSFVLVHSVHPSIQMSTLVIL